jgi:putative transcriptional regulator
MTMIKHHVPNQMLEQFAQGLLPASLAAAVSIHTDMCKACRQKVMALQKACAEQTFDFELADTDFALEGFDMSAMIDQITFDSSREKVVEPTAVNVNLGDIEFQLPRPLQQMEVNKPVGLGKIARAKIELGEGAIHTHLLHMGAGGEVPQHTHQGFEVTLLLQGTFEDEMGEYVPGDFIMLDGEHTHTPTSPSGCVCLTVVSDALTFTSGLSRLLNPFGKFIY